MYKAHDKQYKYDKISMENCLIELGGGGGGGREAIPEIASEKVFFLVSNMYGYFSFVALYNTILGYNYTYKKDGNVLYELSLY